MTCIDVYSAPLAPRRSSLGARLAGLFGRGVNKLLDWQERSEQRGYLAGMDERMRKDIGISHADALREADKPFWRP